MKSTTGIMKLRILPIITLLVALMTATAAYGATEPTNPLITGRHVNVKHTARCVVIKHPKAKDPSKRRVVKCSRKKTKKHPTGGQGTTPPVTTNPVAPPVTTTPVSSPPVTTTTTTTTTTTSTTSSPPTTTTSTTSAPPTPPPSSGTGASTTGATTTPTLPAAQPVANPGAAPPAQWTPLWFQQAYDLTGLSATAGQGQTVAVFNVGQDPNLESELATFRATYNLPACTSANGCFSTINPGGSNEPTIDESWAIEADLDVDAISTVCPNCHIMFVEDQNSNLIQDAQVAKADGATVFSLSATWDTTRMTDPGSVLPSVESTGDNGPGGSAETPDGYSDDTAAGGTTLVQDIQTPRGYMEYTWDGAGSGCLTTIPQPSWQSNLNTDCQGRAYSDLSADANPYTGMLSFTAEGWLQVGGTSLAAPMVASYYALMQSQNVNQFGNPSWAYGSNTGLNSISEDFPSAGVTFPIDNYSNQSTQSYPADTTSYCSNDPSSPLCSAQNGAWSGESGNGSISGSLIAGVPGIGSNGYVSGTNGGSLTVAGGAYSNNLTTQVWLQFGGDNTYGYSTAPITLQPGQSVSSVSFTIPANYVQMLGGVHYRLVASNADGTAYGYDENWN